MSEAPVMKRALLMRVARALGDPTRAGDLAVALLGRARAPSAVQDSARVAAARSLVFPNWPSCTNLRRMISPGRAKTLVHCVARWLSGRLSPFVVLSASIACDTESCFEIAALRPIAALARLAFIGGAGDPLRFFRVSLGKNRRAHVSGAHCTLAVCISLFQALHRPSPVRELHVEGYGGAASEDLVSVCRDDPQVFRDVLSIAVEVFRAGYTELGGAVCQTLLLERWSTPPVFCAELASIELSFGARGPSPLDPVSCQFVDKSLVKELGCEIRVRRAAMKCIYAFMCGAATRRLFFWLREEFSEAVSEWEAKVGPFPHRISLLFFVAAQMFCDQDLPSAHRWVKRAMRSGRLHFGSTASFILVSLLAAASASDERIVDALAPVQGSADGGAMKTGALEAAVAHNRLSLARTLQVRFANTTGGTFSFSAEGALKARAREEGRLPADTGSGLLDRLTQRDERPAFALAHAFGLWRFPRFDVAVCRHWEAVRASAKSRKAPVRAALVDSWSKCQAQLLSNPVEFAEGAVCRIMSDAERRAVIGSLVERGTTTWIRGGVQRLKATRAVQGSEKLRRLQDRGATRAAFPFIVRVLGIWELGERLVGVRKCHAWDPSAKAEARSEVKKEVFRALCMSDWDTVERLRAAGRFIVATMRTPHSLARVATMFVRAEPK